MPIQIREQWPRKYKPTVMLDEEERDKLLDFIAEETGTAHYLLGESDVTNYLSMLLDETLDRLISGRE